MGRYFGCDPVDLLERDYFRWAVSIAAYDVASKAEAEASKRKR